MPQDFFSLNKQVAAAIDKRLEVFFADKIARAGRIDRRFRQLLVETERVVRLGGKRLRPTLAVIGYRAAGGKDDELALDAAVALELLHTFMCVHDDIMDKDDVRHGGLNVTGRYKKILRDIEQEDMREQLAESMSLLVGDTLFSFVYEIIASLEVSPEVRLQLIKKVSDTTFATVGGQQLDIMYPLEGEVSVKRLLKIPHYKTGIYTFVSPLVFGATLAGNDQPKLIEAFQRYGENMGITFQVTDDILGMFGSTKNTGKPIVSDLRENKPTILRHYAFQFSNPIQLAVLKKSFGKTDADGRDLQAVKKVMINNGARAKAYSLAREYSQQAMADLLPVKNNHQLAFEQLIQLAGFCLDRDH